MKMFAKIKKASMKTLCLFMVLLLIGSFAPVVIDAGAEEIEGELPLSYDISMQSYFPEIGNQGGYGSCAAWATVYYQFGYHAAKVISTNGSGEQVDNRFSPLYLYMLINSAYSSKASAIFQYYPLLQEIGSLRYGEYNPDCEDWVDNKWFVKTTETGNIDYDSTVESLMEALKTRVTSWNSSSFASTDEVTPITPDDTTVLDELRELISTDHVLAFSVESASSLYETTHPNDAFPLASNAQSYIPFLKGGGSGHAMVIVGYDDNLWCDLDKDGERDDFELGALKVANSWASSWGTNGYIWLPYDALNAVSYSTDADVCSDRRIAAIENNEYYYIEVSRVAPELTVEVTIAQSNRTGFSIGLQRENYAGEIYCDTVYNGAKPLGYISSDGQKEPTDFEGDYETPSYSDRVFVFDYSSSVYNEDEIYGGRSVYDAEEDAVYSVVIEDFLETDGDTIVKKIVWRDSNGTELQTLSPNEILDTERKIYTCGTFVESVSLTSFLPSLIAGQSKNFEAVAGPNNATQRKIIWLSSDTSVAKVDENGVVTGIGNGSAVITALAMDGSGKSDTKSITVSIPYEFHSDRPNVSQDSRRAHFEITLSNKLTNLELHVGARTYTINKTSNNTINTYINDGYIDSVADRVRVKFTPIEGTENVKWDIQIQLSQPTLSGTETVSFNVSDNENLSFVINDNREYTFWKSSIRTGITPTEEGVQKIKNIIDSLPELESGYEYVAVDCTTLFRIADTAGTNAGTGIVILKRAEGDMSKVYEVIHLLIYGDITGNGVIGDGLIEVDDAMRVLQHYAETDELTDEIFLLAADIDGNGMVTRSDAQAIMDYSSGLTDGAYYQLLHNQNRQVNIYNSIIYNGYTVAFQ